MKTNNSYFDSMVERYYPAVFHVAAKITPTPRAAMDLTYRILEVSFGVESGLGNASPQVDSKSARRPAFQP